MSSSVCCSSRFMSLPSGGCRGRSPGGPGAPPPGRLAAALALDLDALLAHLVRDRLVLGLDALLHGDALLRDRLLLHDGLLAAERNLDLLLADLRAGDRLVDRLARHARRLALELDVHRDRLRLDPLAQADAAGVDAALADLQLLLRAGHLRRAGLDVAGAVGRARRKARVGLAP